MRILLLLLYTTILKLTNNYFLFLPLLFKFCEVQLLLIYTKLLKGRPNVGSIKNGIHEILFE